MTVFHDNNAELIVIFIFAAVVSDQCIPSVQWQVQKIMDKFVSSIKKKCKERLINREAQWPPCHSNKLVKLELVEREGGRRGGKVLERTSIEYTDLFTEKEGKKS